MLKAFKIGLIAAAMLGAWRVLEKDASPPPFLS